MIDRVPEGEIKICCATFYQSDVVHMLLGDVLHPGGLELTQHLGEAIALNEKDMVLDVACGRGESAIHLAERFGCHVTGLDYGQENVVAADNSALKHNVAYLTTFREGDAEGLPFTDGLFDAVISECSFCTFPDKAKAATEMSRVLLPGGRMGLTDMTVNGTLPDDIQSLLPWVACVAGAGTPDQYIAILKGADLGDFLVEDHSSELLSMVNDIRRKLLAVELASALGKLELGGLDLSEGKRVALRAVELIEKGLIGYTLITAKKI